MLQIATKKDGQKPVQRRLVLYPITENEYKNETTAAGELPSLRWLFFSDFLKLRYDAMQRINLTVGQFGNINRLSSGHAEQIVRCNTEVCGNPNQNIECWIAKTIFVFTDNRFGKTDLCTKLLLREVTGSSELFEIFSKFRVIHSITALRIVYRKSGI